MSLSMVPLLAHSDSIPPQSREAFARAMKASPTERPQLLEIAAKTLWRQTELPCADIRDLIGDTGRR